jgi:hypothetical protein
MIVSEAQYRECQIVRVLPRRVFLEALQATLDERAVRVFE